MHTRRQGMGNQNGFAAIVIAIVLVLVLSLTTLGFAELMRNEEKSATDRHLSSQAYYAAESGINDAAKAVNAVYVDRKDTCAPLATGTGPAEYLKKNEIGNGSGNKYTCLLIDPTPKTLEFDSVDNGQKSKAFVVTGTDPSDASIQVPIKELVIGWQDEAGSQTFVASGHSFKTQTEWADTTGVLRVGVTPLVSGGIDRESLSKSNYNGFFYPSSAGAAASPAPASYYPGYLEGSSGNITNGNCHTGNPANSSETPRYCNVKITGLDQTNYLVDLRSIYRSSRVTVMAFGFDGTQLRIKNAQTMVDSTGKAQDVLRRVQVRLPSKNTYIHSNFATETTDDICKQLELTTDSDSVNRC